MWAFGKKPVLSNYSHFGELSEPSGVIFHLTCGSKDIRTTNTPVLFSVVSINDKTAYICIRAEWSDSGDVHMVAYLYRGHSEITNDEWAIIVTTAISRVVKFRNVDKKEEVVANFSIRARDRLDVKVINHKTEQLITRNTKRACKQECCVCGVTDVPMKKCGGCKIVYYCSEKCQKKAWMSHKRHCVLYSKLD